MKSDPVLKNFVLFSNLPIPKIKNTASNPLKRNILFLSTSKFPKLELKENLNNNNNNSNNNNNLNYNNNIINSSSNNNFPNRTLI